MHSREGLAMTFVTRALRNLLLGALAAAPPTVSAFAETGTRIDPVALPALAGGKQPLLAPTARASVLVFFRPDQERSIDALRQLASCEQDLAGKGVRWVVLASGTTPTAGVPAALASAGNRMPVLIDEGDKLYNKLEIRMYPAVAIVDGKGVLQAVQPYRQLDFVDVIKARVRFALGEIDQAALNAALDPAASPLPEDPMQKATRDVNLARKLLELNQLDAAVKQAQRALEQAPVPAAFPVLGMAYAKLGRCAEARRALDQAEKVMPASADIAPARALCAGK
jgi:tetratricopeptide (TPR) repeat protein